MNCKLLQKTDKTFSFKHPSTTKEDVTSAFSASTCNDNKVRGEVKNNILQKGLDVVHQYAAKLIKTAKEFLSNVYKSSTPAKKLPADGVQCGRSMIEMLGVLAIIGVLSVGGIAGFSKMLAHQKIMQTQEQINAIAAKLSSVGAEASSFSGLNNKTAIKFGAIPSEAIVDAKAGTLQNPYKGEIKILPTIDEASYLIIYTKLPKDACIALATMEWGGNNSSFVRIGAFSTEAYLGQGLLGTAMNSDNEGTIEKNLSVVFPADKTPISPSDAVNGCSCPQNICVMAWRFN